jgi:RimJ/RimL family protein N-acetyltransferase
MLSVFNDLGMRRVQGAVSVNWEEAARFAHYMGFEEEGVMRKYGPDGSDYIRVAWVR